MAGPNHADAKTPPSPSSPRTFYLTLYNLTLAFLWLSILTSTLLSIPHGRQEIFNATCTRTQWVQTAMLLEVLHAATGIIKSPVSTTALQVVTRVIQVWMVWYCFPDSTASSHAYGALATAWSMADSVRYTYLALNLHDIAPRWLVWLRYTMFYPLYPIGMGAEWWLLYRAIAPGGKMSAVIPPVFYFCLALYFPGSYKMYTYMIKQRKRALR